MNMARLCRLSRYLHVRLWHLVIAILVIRMYVLQFVGRMYAQHTVHVG